MYAFWLIVLVLAASFIVSPHAQPVQDAPVTKLYIDSCDAVGNNVTMPCFIEGGRVTGSIPAGTNVVSRFSTATCPDEYTLMADADGKPKCVKGVIEPTYK